MQRTLEHVGGWRLLLFAGLLAVLVVGVLRDWPPTPRDAFATPVPQQVERGRYLVTAMGCNDCHTPWKAGANGPEPDMSRMLSGHPESLKMPSPPEPVGPWGIRGASTMTAWAGPWGVSFAANLTPDEETGLGSWSEDQFVAAIRSGRHQGRGRPILPPMPTPNVASLSDEDLSALFSYLQSIPALKNHVPEPLPPTEH